MRRGLCGLAAALLAVGCAGGGDPAPALPLKVGGEPKVVATFAGSFDGAELRLTAVEAGSGDGGASGALLQEVPVVQDGRPGTNPPDTLELVTESIDLPGAGCGALESIDAMVRVRSFFARAQLTDVLVEITDMTPDGRTGCNSIPVPPGELLTDAFGLFAYAPPAGVIDRLGGASPNSDAALWRFQLPDRQPFTFHGRVVANLWSDTAPPVTHVLPEPGYYPASPAFMAWCDDHESELPFVSGCKGVHLTLDGSEPTVESPMFEGNFPLLEGTTTIRVAAEDFFGNLEAPRTLVYVVDTVAPRIAATSPAPFAVVPDPAAAPISVTFDEPMQPSTAGALSLELLAGSAPPAGTWVQSPDGATFSFEPAEPFASDAVHAIRLSTASPLALDLAGNLAPDALVPFKIGAPYRMTGLAGHSDLANVGLATDGGAIAVAVWTDSTGAGTRLFASLAGQPPVLLETAVGEGAVIPARVEAVSGYGLVAWSANGRTRTALLEPFSPLPMWIADLWDAESPDGSFALCPGPGELRIVRAAADGQLEERLGFPDGTWNPATPLGVVGRWPAFTTVPGEFVPELPRLSFVADDESLWTMAQDEKFLGAWMPPQVVPGTGGEPIAAPPRLLSTGTGTALFWTTAGGAVRAAVDDGAGYGVPEDFGIYPSITSGAPPQLAAAGGGGGAAAVWLQDGQAYGAIRAAGAWGPVTPLSQGGYGAAQGVDVAATSVGFTARVVAQPGTYADCNLLRYDFAFGGFPAMWSSPWRERVLSDGSGEPKLAGSGFDAIYTLVEGVPIPSESPDWLVKAERLTTSYSPDWNALPLEQVAHGSEARAAGASFAGAPGGFGRADVGVAFFLRELRGVDHPSRAEFSASASPLEELGPPGYFFGKAIEADGPTLVTVDTAPGATVATIRIMEQAGTSAPPYDYESAQWELPDAAGRAGMTMVGWADGGSIHYLLREGGLWNGPVHYAEAAWPPSIPAAVSVAVGGSGPAIAWRYESPAGPRPVVGGFGSYPSVFSEVVVLDAPVGPSGPRVAVGDVVSTEFGSGPTAVVAWEAGGAVLASTRHPALGGWSTPTTISTGGACGSPAVASNGLEFAVIFACDGQLYGRLSDAYGWTELHWLGGGATGFAVAGVPSGFRVLAVLDDGGTPHLFSVELDPYGAGMPVRLDDAPGAVRPDVSINSFPVGSAPAGFVCAAWSQVDQDPLAARGHAACFF